MSQVADPSARIQQVLAEAWSRTGLRDVLQVIAEGVTQVAGFGVACVSVLHESDELEIIAVAGGDDEIQGLIGRFTPRSSIDAELANSEDWGALKFVPHNRLPEGVPLTWVPDLEPLDSPDAWHPLDLLIAPLYDGEGVMRGLLSVDVPDDGLRPGPERRRILELYVEQAARALTRAIEESRMVETVRLAEAARAIVRQASASLSPRQILEQCQPAILEGFTAQGLWMQLVADDQPGHAAITDVGARPLTLPPHLVEIAETAARACWREQRVGVISRRRTSTGVIPADQREEVLEFLESIGTASMLFVPIGVGHECLGNLVLTRTHRDLEWTDVEQRTALDIGHDLGRALLNARLFERDQQLVRRLQELDTYKSRLISTISHEFKNPLTSILGHVELLEHVLVDNPGAMSSVEAIGRGSARLNLLVEDLLQLSRLADPERRVEPVPVDIKVAIRDALDLLGVQSAAKDLTITSTAPEGPTFVDCVPQDLDLVCTNLISNAVKYTPAGRAITINVTQDERWVGLMVADEGIGISPADQQQLFDEFFRSSDPQAAAQPGTGLGLAIVGRVVGQHGGTIRCASELGQGTTFVVRLPRSAAA